MKILVVDDELPARQRLTSYFGQDELLQVTPADTSYRVTITLLVHT